MKTFTVTVPGKLSTVNKERSGNMWAHRAATKLWREAGFYAAVAARPLRPHFSQVTITAQPFQSRGVLADCGAHLPPTKAVIDGLVDAGVLLGDSPQYVRSLTFLAPLRGPDGLQITIDQVPGEL